MKIGAGIQVVFAKEERVAEMSRLGATSMHRSDRRKLLEDALTIPGRSGGSVPEPGHEAEIHLGEGTTVAGSVIAKVVGLLESIRLLKMLLFPSQVVSPVDEECIAAVAIHHLQAMILTQHHKLFGT